MSETPVRILSILLAAVWSWAALSKLIYLQDWKASLGAYKLGRFVRDVAFVTVPLGEAVVVALLVFVSVKAGAALALVLLGAFSLAVLHAVDKENKRLPCGCFGRSKARDIRALLARNAILAVLLAIVLSVEEDFAIVGEVGAPRAADIVPAILVVVGLGVIAVMVRYAGGLLRR